MNQFSINKTGTLFNYLYPAILGTALLILIPYQIDLNSSLSSSGTGGTKIFPQLIGWGMIVISIFKILKAVIQKKVEKVETNSEFKMSRSVVKSFLIIGAYPIIMYFLGYVVSTFLFMNIFIYYFGKLTLWKSLLFSTIVTFIVWFAFDRLLNINLPGFGSFL